MDAADKTTRSRIMSRVRQKNTGPEMILRKSLHKMGLRYRLHDKQLPGSPDLVLPRFKAVLFVHGCFWHRHGCEGTTTPRTNSDFWRKKFDANVARDRRNIETLKDTGWRVAVVWECSLKCKRGDLNVVARLVYEWLVSSEKHMVIPANEQLEAQL